MKKEIWGTIIGIAGVGLAKHYFSGSKNDDEEGVIKFPFKGNRQDLPNKKPVPENFWKMFPGPHLEEVPSEEQMARMQERRNAYGYQVKEWIENLRENAKNMQFEVESVSPQDLESGRIIELPIVSVGNERYTIRELAQLAQDRKHERWFIKNFGRVVLRTMRGYNI